MCGLHEGLFWAFRLAGRILVRGLHEESAQEA